MSSPPGWQQIIGRIAGAAKALAVKLRSGRAREPMPAMIGIPPSARYPAIPADPAEHAVRSGHEWADVAETYTAGTHEGAELRAADTALPISDQARLILRAIADRENQRGAR